MNSFQDLEVPAFEVTLPNRPIVRSETRDEQGELIRRRSELVTNPKEIPTSPQRVLRHGRTDYSAATRQNTGENGTFRLLGMYTRRRGGSSDSFRLTVRRPVIEAQARNRVE